MLCKRKVSFTRSGPPTDGHPSRSLTATNLRRKEKNEPPFKGEYRTFYLSPFELGHEEKMLAVYQAEDLDDLLLSTCIMLESQSQLLMRIQPDEQIPTFYVKEWGTLVYHIYLRLQSVYEVIHAMKLVSTSKK